MITYPRLIPEVCKTDKMIEVVSKAIPILIRWAQNGITTNHYKDLNRELGYTTYSGIGKPLGLIEDVLKELSNKMNIDIPSLNALCTNSTTNLPSYGFGYVIPNYESLNMKAKKLIVDGYNKRAIDFKSWDIVLNKLCLSPSFVSSEKDEEKIKKGDFTKYSESQFHKKLKQYILENPESIGLKNIILAETEVILLSGDRLDVYFQQKDKTRIAVEVKSRISPDDDILRGIFQCVKYKSILDAENRLHCEPSRTRTILVLETSLSESNYKTKDLFGIEVIESFKY